MNKFFKRLMGDLGKDDIATLDAAKAIGTSILHSHAPYAF
jgi:hypothetical protein